MSELVRLAKSGDPTALEKLLNQIAPSIQRFGAKMCRNGHDADDVLQDTLMTILRHLHEFEGRSSFTSWVFTLTRTACNRRRRGLKNQPAEPLEKAVNKDAEGPTPEQGANNREMSQILEKALEDLPEEYREVILLRDVEALTAPEATGSKCLRRTEQKSELPLPELSETEFHPYTEMRSRPPKEALAVGPAQQSPSRQRATHPSKSHLEPRCRDCSELYFRVDERICSARLEYLDSDQVPRKAGSPKKPLPCRYIVERPPVVG